MATWRERRAWRREFKRLGIRQVWERELLPYAITAIATINELALELGTTPQAR
jgi:hypothetical protein